MFYDERIEFEKGRISKNCIIISVVASLIYGALYLINMITEIENPGFRQFFHLGVEAVIIISGLVCLIAGFCKGAFSKDERRKAESNRFYNKAAFIHLCVTVTAWAFIMPFALAYPLPRINFLAFPYDYGLTLLFFPIESFASIAVLAVLFGIMVFLSTQLSAYEFSQAKAIFGGVVYVYYAVIVAFLGSKKIGAEG